MSTQRHTCTSALASGFSVRKEFASFSTLDSQRSGIWTSARAKRQFKSGQSIVKASPIRTPTCATAPDEFRTHCRLAIGRLQDKSSSSAVLVNIVVIVLSRRGAAERKEKKRKFCPILNETSVVFCLNSIGREHSLNLDMILFKSSSFDRSLRFY